MLWPGTKHVLGRNAIKKHSLVNSLTTSAAHCVNHCTFFVKQYIKYTMFKLE